MPVIGLTGNIGSGKSSVARLLRSLGAQVIDADQVAREVVLPGTPALAELTREFGPGILDAGGSLDRKKMGDIVFADPAARARLNQITHPRIKEALDRVITGFRQDPYASSPSGVLVIEAPLLIEVGLNREVDEVWVVKVDEDKQVERLVDRDTLSTQEVRSRIAAQLPQALKLKYARRVIDNSGDFSATKKQVEHNWDELQKEHLKGKYSI
ncbi:MAG: dephospho-CoA kinase [Desulfotomaculaceae bacterium]|nr:dephospho-CoA kinase [Desulfotomaculaceae bacterium]